MDFPVINIKDKNISFSKITIEEYKLHFDQYTKEILSIIGISRKDFQHLYHEIEHSTFKIKKSNKTIGFALFSDRHPDVVHPRIYLGFIFIKPRYRRMGYGSFLFKACEHYAKLNGYTDIHLDFDRTDPVAFKFYKKVLPNHNLLN
jgi:ribosomal protein S18 acetylase RimI-like enzyme